MQVSIKKRISISSWCILYYVYVIGAAFWCYERNREDACNMWDDGGDDNVVMHIETNQCIQSRIGTRVRTWIWIRHGYAVLWLNWGLVLIDHLREKGYVRQKQIETVSLSSLFINCFMYTRKTTSRTINIDFVSGQDFVRITGCYTTSYVSPGAIRLARFGLVSLVHDYFIVFLGVEIDGRWIWQR